MAHTGETMGPALAYMSYTLTRIPASLATLVRTRLSAHTKMAKHERSPTGGG